MRKVHTGRRPRLAVMAVAAVLAAGSWPSAQAVSFRSGSGDWGGSWDTTIGYGQGWRVSDRDCRLIGIANGGCGHSPNIDDGDLNYGKGTYSKAVKGVTEFVLNYKDRGGFFVRGDGLYDAYVMGNNTERTPLSTGAKNPVGSKHRSLD